MKNDTIFVHWAQAYCYGYLYAKQSHLEQLIIQLTYFQIETNEIKQFQKTLSFNQLETYYMDFLKRYIREGI